MGTSNSSGQGCLTVSEFSAVEKPGHIFIAEKMKEQVTRRLSLGLRWTFDLLMDDYSLAEIVQNLNLSYEAVRLRVKNISKLAAVYVKKNLGFW